MSNTPKIFAVTKKIKKVYNRLYDLDKNNNLNEEYYNLIEILKDLLIKEDEIYKSLTDEDIEFLVSHYILRKQYPKESIGNTSYDFNKMVDDNDFIYERINIRTCIYAVMNELGDINWYQNLYRGIYLIENSDISLEDKFYYYFISSSWSVVNYINNITSEYYNDDHKLLMKYINLFLEPYSESAVVKNNFNIDYDYSYVNRVNDINNDFATYNVSARSFLEIRFSEFISNLMYGGYTEIDDYVMDMIIGLDSYLQLINENMKEAMLLESIDKYRMANTTPNPCTELYFSLYNDRKYIKKKDIDI